MISKGEEKIQTKIRMEIKEVEIRMINESIRIC
jgi:hypothetical protein